MWKKNVTIDLQPNDDIVLRSGVGHLQRFGPVPCTCTWISKPGRSLTISRAKLLEIL